MQRLNEGGGEGAAIDGATEIARIDLVAAHTLADQVHANLEIGDELGTALLQHFQRAADMVAVAMGQEHMGDAFGRTFPAAGPGRIADQIGIDEDGGVLGLDAECLMSVPGQFHECFPRFLRCRKIERSQQIESGAPLLNVKRM